MLDHQTIQPYVITTDSITDDLLISKNIQLSVLRLDKIHPIVSGNKWFKLKYYIQDAKEKSAPGLLTFGGAYSNHIAAAAYAAAENGLPIIGVIRGEEPAVLSHTLQAAKEVGMHLHFVPRIAYDKHRRNLNISWLPEQFKDYYIVPEGGMGEYGVLGVGEILNFTNISEYTHVILAAGTGTTATGILQRTNRQQVIAISAMKNNKTLSAEIEALFMRSLPDRFRLLHDYHFGGYAKYTPELLEWMNKFYHRTNIPLDFVYTGKMMYGVYDLIGKDFFSRGSTILAVHTGGLQGNRSLRQEMLDF